MSAVARTQNSFGIVHLQVDQRLKIVPRVQECPVVDSVVHWRAWRGSKVGEMTAGQPLKLLLKLQRCFVSATTLQFPQAIPFFFSFFVRVCLIQPARSVSTETGISASLETSKGGTEFRGIQGSDQFQGTDRLLSGPFAHSCFFFAFLCRFFRKGVPGCEEDSVL